MISFEQEKKQLWLGELSKFVVIANNKTWAADGIEVIPESVGFKELQWPYPSEQMSEQDWQDYKGWEDWRLRDRYTGYFRAPGMTTVYYKGVPAWTMHYGGHGQTESYYPQAKQTFTFLKQALMRVSPELPIRGPRIYMTENNVYTFEMLNGNLEDGLWREKVIEDGDLTFTQTGLNGLVINRTADRQPLYPWNL